MNPMQLFWLECVAADLPGHLEWLSPDERSCVSRLRFPKRRDDWLLGRWTAKCAIAAYLDADLVLFPRITILPDASGAPVAQVHGSAAVLSISISHRAGRGLAVLAPGELPVGADLEWVEPHGHVFTEDYFTPQEREQLGRSQDLEPDEVSTLLWSAKESALKLLRLGLKADTRCVSIELAFASEPGSHWKPFEAAFVDGRTFCGWWQQSGNWIRTQVGAFPSVSPVELPHLFPRGDRAKCSTAS
jgi:4'-phosphopantetheinyl transferase